MGLVTSELALRNPRLSNAPGWVWSAFIMVSTLEVNPASPDMPTSIIKQDAARYTVRGGE